MPISVETFYRQFVITLPYPQDNFFLKIFFLLLNKVYQLDLESVNFPQKNFWGSQAIRTRVGCLLTALKAAMSERCGALLLAVARHAVVTVVSVAHERPRTPSVSLSALTERCGAVLVLVLRVVAPSSEKR